MADDVTITVHVRDLTGPGFNSVSRNINQLQRQANQMGGSLRIVGGQLDDVASSAANAGQNLGGGMGLRGQAIGAAAALGTSLLPTIGALAPMLTGLAVVGGGAALAMDDLKKKAKELKKPFEEWQKTANKAVAPHTEKAVKSLKSAMEDLNPVIETGADTFGRIAEKAARFVDSPAFKTAFAKNAEMGSKWVEEFAGSVGTFTQSFLEFGTKSQPALDAWDNLLGGLLDRGLPGMFKEMEQGIQGSSDVLDGLAYVVNDSLLPSLGKVAGSFTEAFGPLIKELLTGAGDQLNMLADIFEGTMEAVEPFANVAADAVRALNEVFAIGASVAGSFAKEVGGALLTSLLEIAGIDTSGLDDGFRGLSDWVKDNQAQIREAFLGIAGAITTMVTGGISMLPTLYSAFQTMTEGILLSIDGLVSGLALAFGGLPVVGDKFKEWNSKFDEFSGNFRQGMDDVGGKLNEFVDEAVPRLNRAQLKINVDQAKASLDSIKERLKDPELTKERKAKLSADKEEAEAKLSAAKRDLAAFDKKKASAKLDADPNSFWNKIKAAAGAKLPKKTAKVDANPNSFWSQVKSIPQVVGSRQINVYAVNKFSTQGTGSKVAPAHRDYASGGKVRGYATGGDVQAYPEGGYVQGPGSGTSDSILTLLGSGNVVRSSNTEFIVNARQTARHRRLLELINSGQLPRFAKGGSVSKQAKAETEARSGARGDLTISHFGQMAGYKTSEIIGQLARADSLGSLVNALNSWRSIIMKATHGAQEKSLLKALDSAGKKLLGWEKQLTKVSASLEKAKDKLDSLKQAAASLSDSVKSGVLSSANITRGAGGDKPVTVASIMGGLTASRDKATAFSKALADLKNKGLSGSLLQQIAEAGIEGGGLETAGALLGASSSEIQSMNDLQSQIGKAAGSAGKTTADAVYGAQIKAQTAYVAMLTKSQDRLTKAMESLAKSLEKSIEKAFKGKAAGGIVGAAASGGIRSNLTWVGEQGPELVNLAPGTRVWSNPDSRRMQQQAWTSMLNEPRRAARTTGAAVAGRPEPVVIELRSSGSDIDEFLLKVLRKAINNRGGDVQFVLTGRK
jgi:hypothetical protein